MSIGTNRPRDRGPEPGPGPAAGPRSGPERADPAPRGDPHDTPEAEAGGHDAERSLAALLHHAPHPVWTKDLTGRYLAVNPAFELAFGVTAAEVLVRGEEVLRDAEAAVAVSERERQVVQSGQAVMGEECFERDGLRQEACVVRYPVRDGAGRVVAVGGIATDVTRLAFVRRRLEELEGRLSASQRLLALGTLAEGVAHDLGNVLLAMGGYVDLALASLAPDAAAAGLLHEAAAAGRRARELLARFADDDRGRSAERPLLKLGPLVQEALKLAAATTPAGVELRCLLPEREPQVRGDATQLLQVFVNLCTNAVAAMPRGGLLLASVEERGDPAGAGRAFVVASLADEGVGMTPEVLARAFDPYFTTRTGRGGHGVGLAVARGIARAHAGEIRARSEPGRGSTFELWLPVAGSAG